MDTPSKITAEEWQRRKAEYLAEKAHPEAAADGTGTVCPACNCRKILKSGADTKICPLCEGSGLVVWKHYCGAPLLGFNTRVSEHDVRFGDACSGMGDTVRIEVPYCPSCEPHPAESGCIHV